ncbi:MAG: Gfo/Idh/MocA family oxidoreductase [Gemmataceae bacterium]|nr:Gfo/Idh/MocA family oxidoreductase [Gemmataceae bacterium]
MSRATRRHFLQQSAALSLGLTAGLTGKAVADNEPTGVPLPENRPPAKPYRVAVIGRQGSYGHGLDVVWKTIANVEIVAVADDNDKTRADAARRLGVKNAYADYREMLEKEKPQIVSVAHGYLGAQRDTVVACAQAGAHMFLEKPMCRTLAEADEMVQACEKHHVKVAIAHQTRYSPRVHRIQEMIASGRLGDLLELRGRGKEDTRGGGQDLLVLGTHIMDLMRAFAGPARWCFATVLQNGRPAGKEDVRQGSTGLGLLLGDHIQATYGFDKGVHGTFGTHRAKVGAGTRFGLALFGTKGVVQLTTGSLPAAYFLDDPSWFPGRSRAAWQEITSAGVGQPELLKDSGLGLANQWVVQDLIAAIENDRQPLDSIYDGRAALEMILAVYEAHRQHRPVEMPLQNRQHPLTML